MPEALLLPALLMGLFGGPHCAAMCGTACAGIARNGRGMLQFQAGRIAGYAALGATAATAFQGAGWLAGATAAARPLWTLFHLATLLLGLTLLWQARQPAWMDHLARGAWQRVRAATGGIGPGPGSHAPVLVGALWALMPCGLLYSALVLATLAGGAAQGAAVMAAFAAGSAVSLALGPWLWRRWRQRVPTDWGTRMAGATLAALSVWALWIAASHQEIPWCVGG